MLNQFLQKKVIKTEGDIQQDVNMERFVNPVIKHTYESLPRIYGHQTKKRYLSKYRLNNSTQQRLPIIKHKCQNIRMKQEEINSMDKHKSLSRFDSNKTVKKNKQMQQIISPTPLEKYQKHQRTKSLKLSNQQFHNKLSMPKGKCNKKYCVCKSLYNEYCEEVRKVFVRNSLDSKMRKNQTYNCKKLPKLSQKKSQSCLDDHESRHKVANIRGGTQNVESNGYSSGLMELIKRRQQILKQKKQRQVREMKDQSIQTINEQENQLVKEKQQNRLQTQDKYVNTDFQDMNMQKKEMDTIQINKADAQNQTQKQEDQTEFVKLKHPKKQPMAHLSQLKKQYKNKSSNLNKNRHCINQHINDKLQGYCTQSQKEKQQDFLACQSYLKKQSNNNQNNINTHQPLENQKQESIRSSNISQISLSKYILKGMSNQNTVFSLLSKKEQQSDLNNNQRQKKIIKLTCQKGLFTIPEEDQYIDYLKGYKPISKNFKVKNLVRSEYFKIIKDNEGLFFGQYKDSQKNGKGLQITQRQIFQGTFHKNIKMDGCQRNVDGTYIGQFLNGKRHGNGKFLWHNGQIFQGQWRLGTKNGFGIWKSPKGDSYEGQWVMNRQHGKGIFKHKNSIYEGQFQNFLKFGSGKQIFANGDKYIGEYQNGKPHGKGKYIWKNGSYYQGQFSKGLRQGYGKWHESDQINYQGQFQNDFKHGKGKQIYKNGDFYEGQFIQGIKTHGVYKSASDGKQIAIQTS